AGMLPKLRFTMPRCASLTWTPVASRSCWPVLATQIRYTTHWFDSCTTESANEPSATPSQLSSSATVLSMTTEHVSHVTDASSEHFDAAKSHAFSWVCSQTAPVTVAVFVPATSSHMQASSPLPGIPSGPGQLSLDAWLGTVMQTGGLPVARVPKFRSTIPRCGS